MQLAENAPGNALSILPSSVSPSKDAGSSFQVSSGHASMGGDSSSWEPVFLACFPLSLSCRSRKPVFSANFPLNLTCRLAAFGLRVCGRLSSTCHSNCSLSGHCVGMTFTYFFTISRISRISHISRIPFRHSTGSFFNMASSFPFCCRPCDNCFGRNFITQ